MKVKNLLIYLLGVIVYAMALSACSSMPLPELSADINYQRDLKFDIEYWDSKKKSWSKKQHFVGVGVLRKTEKYRVTIYAIGKVDMITLSSCHREYKKANPQKSWWTKGTSFEFTPVHHLESDKACHMDAGIYEKKKGRGY